MNRERRRRVAILIVILLCFLLIVICMAVTANGKKKNEHKEIEIVPAQGTVTETVTPRPDFDLRHLSLVGDKEKPKNGRYDEVTRSDNSESDGSDSEAIGTSGEGIGSADGSDRSVSEANEWVDNRSEGLHEYPFTAVDDNPDMDGGISDNNDTAERVESNSDNDSNDSESDLTYLGSWIATAYCACEICTGEYATGYTASGTLATEGRTIACNSLPLGTQVYIEGYGYYTVEDTGYTPYGDAWVDIFYSSHDSALAFGVRQVELYLVN